MLGTRKGIQEFPRNETSISALPPPAILPTSRRKGENIEGLVRRLTVLRAQATLAEVLSSILRVKIAAANGL